MCDVMDHECNRQMDGRTVRTPVTYGIPLLDMRKGLPKVRPCSVMIDKAQSRGSRCPSASSWLRHRRSVTLAVMAVGGGAVVYSSSQTVTDGTAVIR